jgi:hypothetical protein
MSPWQRSGFYVLPVVLAVVAAASFGSAGWPLAELYFTFLLLASVVDWRYRRYTERLAASPGSAPTHASSDPWAGGAANRALTPPEEAGRRWRG